jgi:hypothetical protein
LVIIGLKLEIILLFVRRGPYGLGIIKPCQQMNKGLAGGWALRKTTQDLGRHSKHGIERVKLSRSEDWIQTTSNVVYLLDEIHYLYAMH